MFSFLERFYVQRTSKEKSNHAVDILSHATERVDALKRMIAEVNQELEKTVEYARSK